MQATGCSAQNNPVHRPESRSPALLRLVWLGSALFGVLTILLAWRLLAEAVRPVQWAGIATVFAGIAVLSVQG
mgnify:CR=1 FL=1